MLNYGTGNPRFNNAPGSLDFTPTTHCIMTKKEPRSEDITRFSQITTANKYFEIGSHLELSYRIYNLTKAQIDALEAVIGETIQFFPHSDACVSFDALVINVQPKMEKNLAFLYYVDISVLSVNYFKFGTNLTLTSPNGSEVLQRNQVYNITWTSYGISGNVALELWKNGSKLSDIDTSEANDGSYAWTVPADATAGTDYQIKILNSTGYIYDLSDANFSIDYDGYYLFDGSNDYVTTPILTTGTSQYTIAFRYIQPVFVGDTYEFVLNGRVNGNNLEDVRFEYISGLIGCRIAYYKRYAAGTTTHINSSIITPDDNWHTCIIVVNRTLTANDRVKIYIDGSDVTSVANADDGTDFVSTKKYDIGVYRSPSETGINFDYYFSGSLSHFLLVSHAFSATDITNYESKNISAIDNKVLWYKCNDADTGAPYTGKTLDSSGNGNHGTPVNINGATFFNQT
jgi:hypothetical protein